jgi:hypothetical protein
MCPECNAPWCDFEGCCALACDACESYFCALCGEGSKQRSRTQAHSHVHSCGKGVDGFHQGFVALEEWKHQNKLRQWRQCRDYLAQTDLELEIKEKLQAEFPHP